MAALIVGAAPAPFVHRHTRQKEARHRSSCQNTEYETERIIVKISIQFRSKL